MTVELRDGTKFPGDQVIYINDWKFTLREVAYAMRLFIKNEELRKVVDPEVNKLWKRDPEEYFLSFIQDAVSAENFDQACKRYWL